MDKLSRKESSENDYGSIGCSAAAGGGGGVGGANSNGTLNMSFNNSDNNSHLGPGQGNVLGLGVEDNSGQSNPCLRTFKACCKKKANFGLEDLFWVLFLIIIIAFSVVKGTTKVGWNQLFYLIVGALITLTILYCVATAFNKFVLEDSSTAHWNAHARFTQAAIQERLREEEQRVHVIAPPKMGGAKLNIIYTVGDVPLARDSSARSSCSGRHASSGSVVGIGASGLSTPTTAVAMATATLIAPTALSSPTKVVSLSTSATTAITSPPSSTTTTTSNTTTTTTNTTPETGTSLTKNKNTNTALNTTNSGTAFTTQNNDKTANEMTTNSTSDVANFSTTNNNNNNSSTKLSSTKSVVVTQSASLLPETIDEESDVDRIESPFEK